MIGKTISHYKIIEKLGEGGMGVVYKARDLKLDRFVALKFLSPKFSSGEEEKQRFINEAKAASALDHNNICTIYEIDEIKPGPNGFGEGRLFISMAYYAGETLAHKIKGERLKIKEVMDVAIQIAQGLARAHESNIIHRDLKPANIMVTPRGEVKIVDFGLAKLSDRTRLTKEATTLGTVAYMSPEQIKGDHVDHRTDLWSLGVIMYEMITGRSPFKGEYEQSLMYTIVNEEPESLADLRPDTPKELTEIVNKAIRKNPTDRYQNLDELLFALKQLRLEDMSELSPPEKLSVTPLRKLILNTYIYYPVAIISTILIIYGLLSLLEEKNEEVDQITGEKFIAVLPFESITKSEQDLIFSEGIFEDIITQLVKIKEFKVIDRRSVGRYRESSKNYREIGDELGVNFIVSGSIRQTSDKIRINARLIETNTEDIIWAESYDQEHSDIFTIQKDVAQKIASTLKIILTPEEKEILDRIPTENREAYNYYQKGNYYWYNYATQETNIRAAEMYEKATELDPTFALALAMHAYVSIALYTEWDDYSEERLNKAKTALDMAIKISPDLPEVHLTLGKYYESIEHNYDKALAEYEKALQNQPNNVDILDDLGTFYLSDGNPKKAVDYFIKSFKINPFGFWSGLWVSNCYYRLRHWNEAEKWVNIYISKHPDNQYGYIRKWQILLYGTGNLSRACEVIQEGIKHTDSTFVQQRVILELYSRRYEAALKVLTSDSSAYYDFYLMNYDLQKAMIHYMAGDLNAAENNFRKAKIIYENLIKEEPDRALYCSNLGLTLAGLGDKAKAIQMGKKGIAMVPLNSEYTLITEQMILNLVYVYIITGEMEQAINQIDFLLSIPCQLTVWHLRLDPIYDPLRDNTIFQKFLEREK